MVERGDIMPSFRLPDQTGTPVLSDDLNGRWFLLYWYPKADTPGCTAQAQGLRDQAEAFDDLGCVVLGASFDQPDDNRLFQAKYRLPFRLLSDLDHVVAEAVGAAEAGAGHPSRVAHLVDPAGRVARRYLVDDPEFFAEAVLDDLESELAERSG